MTEVELPAELAAARISSHCTDALRFWSVTSYAGTWAGTTGIRRCCFPAPEPRSPLKWSFSRVDPAIA